jgi:predicted RNA-binding protein YlqC (UPF0109 family)
MGNKVNPVGMRLQVNRTWDSRWFANTKDYGNLLLEDLKIKDFVRDEAKQAGISRVIIERPHRKCRVTIHAARPGVIIGKKGADIETLRKKLAALTKSGTAPQHRRGTKAGTRCRACRRIDCPAARTARLIPPRDEAGSSERDAHGCARHPR